MKLRRDQGFAVVSVMVLSSLLYSYALSYMDILSTESRIIKSAENSLRAEAVAEAAAEEVMWEYNYGGGDFTTGDGWVTQGSIRTKTVSAFTDVAGTSIGSYVTTITNFGASNTQVSVASTTTGGGQATTATIKFASATTSPYTNAITSAGLITLNGSNVTESYISANGAYGGSNQFSNGDIATTSGASPAIEINGSNQVKGDVSYATGGSLSNSGSGTITGSVSSGFTATLTNNTVPSSLSSLSATTFSGTTLSAGSYKYASWTINGSKNITVNGDVSIYVTGSITINGSNNIKLSSGASLKIYHDGNVNINGSNTLGMASGAETPASVMFYGTSSLSSVSVNGSNNVTAVVNVPNASYTVNGSNNVYGSIVAASATVNGNNNIRYDESLATAGGGSGQKLKWIRRTA